MSQGWNTGKNRRKFGSNTPRRFTEYFSEEGQYGHRQYSPRLSHEAHYRTPPPLRLRNSFGPLSTPYSRGTEANLDEEDEDQDSYEVRSKPQTDRDRSPLKSQLATVSSDSQLPPETQKAHASLQPIHLSHPDTQAAPALPNPVETTSEADLPMTQAFFQKFMMSFSREMKSNVNKVRKDVNETRREVQSLAGFFDRFMHETDQRFNKLESRVMEITAAHNELLDAHQEPIKENKWIREKLADSEDRNRRNNVRFRGVPETVSSTELKSYIMKLIHALYPTLTELELTIDRAHRLPKPAQLPAHLPRDVIARIHYFHVKELLMDSTRKGKSLPDDYKGLALFRDLSKATLKARKEFLQVTNTLRYKKIDYNWGHNPTKLIFTEGNWDKHIARSPREGQELLYKWNIPIHVPRDPKKDKLFKPPISPKPQRLKPVAMDTTTPPPEDGKSAEAAGTT